MGGQWIPGILVPILLRRILLLRDEELKGATYIDPQIDSDHCQVTSRCRKDSLPVAKRLVNHLIFASSYSIAATHQIGLCFVSHRSADTKIEGATYAAPRAIAKWCQLGRDRRARKDAVEMHKATEKMVIGNNRETLKRMQAARSESANCFHETTMARERRDMLVPYVF